MVMMGIWDMVDKLLARIAVLENRVNTIEEWKSEQHRQMHEQARKEHK